jgi:hypothetical protein
MSDLAQASASVAGLNSLKAIITQIPVLQSQPPTQAAELPAVLHAPVAVESKIGKKTRAVSTNLSAHKHSFSNTLAAIDEVSKETSQSVV